MYLLQVAQDILHSIHDPHDAADLSFNITQVVVICSVIFSGILSIAGLYYTMKSSLALVNQRVDSLEKGLKETKREFEQLEKNIGNKLDEVSKALHEIAIEFANFKSDVTKLIYKNGK